VEVTAAFYKRSSEIWGPMAEDWQAALSRRFTRELERMTDFLRVTAESGRRHLKRLCKLG